MWVNLPNYARDVKIFVSHVNSEQVTSAEETMIIDRTAQSRDNSQPLP